MKYLLFPLFLLCCLVACEEVEEVGKYDNWQARNEAFIDSLKSVAGDRIVMTAEGADAMQPGVLFAIPVPVVSTSDYQAYVYCKKVTANTTGVRPFYTGSVDVYYYGTFITGDSFDGNFTGYSSLDKTFSGDKNPTEFDAYTTFSVSGVVTGWTEAQQYMREGERWMVYLPYTCAYGTDDSGSIPGYSALTFDIVLKAVDNE